MNKKIITKLLTILTLLTVSVTMFAFTNVSASTNQIKIEGYKNYEEGFMNIVEYKSSETLILNFYLDAPNSHISLYENKKYIDNIPSILNNNVAVWIATFESDVLVMFMDNTILTKSFIFEIHGNDMSSKIISDGKTYFGYDSGEITIEMNPTIPDNSKPIIEGDIHNFISNYDDPKTVDYFKSFLSATDDTDGDITDKIKIEVDEYTGNEKVLGSHKLVFSVTDKAGNKAVAETYVRVVDITAPIINGASTVATIGYKETFSIENFRKTLTVTDNHDNITNSSIKIKTDNYTKNKNKLGTYSVVFEVSDSSGNVGIFEKKIKVIDNVAPLFSGPTTIASNNNTILTESEIRAKLTANDEIDGNLTNLIKLVEDNYTGNGNKVGKYTIKYSVTDKAGNTAYHVVTIDRIDKIPPIIWIKDGVSIITDPTMPLTFEQIVGILQATGQVNNHQSTRYMILYDEYTGNETNPGTYVYSIQSKSVDGSEAIHNMSITVADNDDSITIPGDNQFVDFIKDNVTYIAIGSVVFIFVLVIITRRKKR